MITDCFDDKTEPVISLRDFYGEQKHLIETCLILFSQKIYQYLLDTFPSEKIGLIGACNGNIPIYRMNYKGKDIAFYLSGIGSAIAASECYEASWIVGASKFVMFGSCGSLNREATRGNSSSRRRVAAARAARTISLRRPTTSRSRTRGSSRPSLPSWASRT